MRRVVIIGSLEQWIVKLTPMMTDGEEFMSACTELFVDCTLGSVMLSVGKEVGYLNHHC